MSELITIDSRVSAYEGSPVRVMAACIPRDGLILIKKLAPYGEPVKVDKNTVVVTDSPTHFRQWQLAFNERVDLAEAVQAYFEKERGGFLKIESGLMKYDPASVLELRKIDKTGAVHEFNSSEVSNGHVAILLAVWASMRAGMGFMVSSQIDDDDDDDKDDESGYDDPTLPYSLWG